MTIDQDIYQALKKILVASGQLDTVIDMFLTNSTLRLASLNQAIADNNPEETYRIAHSIKGSCSMLGGAHCAELCKAIEDLTNPFNADKLKEFSNKLNLELESMSKFLQNERTNGSSTCCE
jgi:HPt (histidine-containing phosphotransfer) domain-containing protein